MVRTVPEHGCSGEVGGVSGMPQPDGSLVTPWLPGAEGGCSMGRSLWAMSTKAAG